MNDSLNLLPPVGMSAIVGPAGSGKTTRMMQVARYCAALGHPQTLFMLDAMPDTWRQDCPAPPQTEFTWEAFDEIPFGSVVLIDGVGLINTLDGSCPASNSGTLLKDLESSARARGIRLLVSIQTKRGFEPASLRADDKPHPFQFTIHL